MIDSAFWRGKKVFITGHTGFKGSWFSLWLHHLGAKVCGYALAAPSEPNLFSLLGLSTRIAKHHEADIRDKKTLSEALQEFQPDIVFHLAAQALVQESYLDPVTTYATNVMGTVHLLEALRATPSARAVVIATTDKVYKDQQWSWAYRENDVLGGYDPYSSSKACTEFVTNAYVQSFFNPHDYANHRTALATARAGNVIGGGDWALKRLIPDCIKAFLNGEEVLIRNPQAVRPWQHVLEPLNGYALLAEKLFQHGCSYNGAWNFGPSDADVRSVEWLARSLAEQWFAPAHLKVQADPSLGHETLCLRLSSSKSIERLGWQPKWTAENTVGSIISWYQAYAENKDMAAVCLQQIRDYGGET